MFYHSSIMRKYSGLSQRILGEDGGGTRVHAGHTYVGNDKWIWTDGSPWTYTKWLRFDLIDPDSSGLQSHRPSGSLYTQGKRAGTLWMGFTDDKLGFACQMSLSNEG